MQHKHLLCGPADLTFKLYDAATGPFFGVPSRSQPCAGSAT
jgi:hypothetical protein